MSRRTYPPLPDDEEFFARFKDHLTAHWSDAHTNGVRPVDEYGTGIVVQQLPGKVDAPDPVPAELLSRLANASNAAREFVKPEEYATRISYADFLISETRAVMPPTKLLRLSNNGASGQAAGIYRDLSDHQNFPAGRWNAPIFVQGPAVGLQRGLQVVLTDISDDPADGNTLRLSEHLAMLRMLMRHSDPVVRMHEHSILSINTSSRARVIRFGRERGEFRAVVSRWHDLANVSDLTDLLHIMRHGLSLDGKHRSETSGSLESRWSYDYTS